jgi:REP element-mobilizing transposase RayT
VPENILILTPYHDFGEMLRLGLTESQTYFPYLTHNSAEALLVASQEKFGLAIIDTEIPGPTFRELWKDLKTMQPDMQLVLIFPEAEEEYPSLDGIAPLGCVDHLLYMPEFLELIDSAFPTVEEVIAIPEVAQNLPSQNNPEITQPVPQQAYDTAWLEDLQIASAHLEKQLPVSSAKAAMIARFDKVLAYSDQLEVAVAQEIANRFTRYWDKDSKNSDLVRFIHLGPMNNTYLLYVTVLVNEAVLAALYQPDTPLSQPHKQISHLARILLEEAPSLPQHGTDSLKIDFIDHPDDVYSQRMRMVTGSLNPLAVPDKNKLSDEKEFFEQDDFEDWEDSSDEDFDPEQFHLEDILSRMPSPDPDAPKVFDPPAPIATPDQTNITQDAVENLRFSWDSNDSVADEPQPSVPAAPQRKPSPWETDGSLDIPKTPFKNIGETLPSRFQSNPNRLDPSTPPNQDAEAREPYPWELESNSSEEPPAPAAEPAEILPFPWELETDNPPEQEPSTPDAVESLRSPWSDTGSLEHFAANEPAIPDEKPRKVDPFTSQDSGEIVRFPRESDSGHPTDSSFNQPDSPDENPGRIDPFTVHDAQKDLPFPWQARTGSLDDSSSREFDQPDEKSPESQPHLTPDAAKNQRSPWETHTAHLTPPPEETNHPPTPAHDAVESLRNPQETNTTSLGEQPPNGHEAFIEDAFEPMPDFADLESTSESPLGNGWHRGEDTQSIETVDTKSANDPTAGTSPLKRPAIRVQPEEEDEYADCVYTYTTFVTPLLKRHALTRELAQILAKSMNTVCKNNHWKLINMTARPSGMLWTARIPPNVTTGQMVKIVREETSEMLYEIHPRLKYEALSENFWAANYLVVSGNDAPDDNSIKEFLQRIHQTNRSNDSRH